MRPFLGLAALISMVCFGSSACADEKKKEEDAPVSFHRTGRAFIPEQRCSLVVVKEWRIQREGKSTTLLVPGEKGSHANILINTWETPLTAEQVANEGAEKMTSKSFQVEKPEAFTTFAKLSGVRLVARGPDKKSVGIQYIFPAGANRILTLTGTFDEKANINFEQSLNLAMKTLHLLDRPHNLPQEPGVRFGDKRATLQVPLGWDARADVPGANAFTPPVIQHSEQMFVNFDRSPVPLEEYAAAETGGNQEKGVRMEKPERFETTAGVVGFKSRGEFRASNGKELRTVIYFFNATEGMKVVVGASAEASQWPGIEALFDACAKSMKIGSEQNEPKKEAPVTETI